jgi:ActR/RegA family two-component response regulator
MAHRIFFLDDDRIRHKRAMPFLLHEAAYTAKQAISMLQKKEYDVICLDHDLGGDVMVNSDREDCGMEVVRWMVEAKPPAKVVVLHSLNHVAAANMCAKLKQAGYFAVIKPFPDFLADMEDFLEMVDALCRPAKEAS